MARPKTGMSSAFLGRCCPGSRIERHIILEHAEKYHGELARKRHLVLVGASAPGDPHCPAFEFRATPDRLGQHDVGSLVKRLAHRGVTVLADAAGVVGLAELILLRGQTEMLSRLLR